MDSNNICIVTFKNCMDKINDILSDYKEIVDKIIIFHRECGELTPNAKQSIAEVFYENGKIELLYADEDYPSVIPWFKPDYSPDTLESFFYIGNIFAIRGTAIDKITCDITIYELVLRLSKESMFYHIPQILFSNNSDEESDKLPGLGECNINSKAFDNDKLVSIIIPSKDNSVVLKKCISSLTTITEYDNYEVIVVDNGSYDREKMCINNLSRHYGFRYIYKSQEFNFSNMCNTGARAAKGDYLLFLNDDIEVIDKKWLSNMVMSVSKPHVGAVGAKLYYPDYTIQHVGITNMGIGPAHKKGDYHGHESANYNMLAVTGACLMIKHELFNSIGCFDESFPIAYNDVELCFRLHEKGYYNVVRNDATLIHHESLSRGEDTSYEKKKRLINEKHKLYEKHKTLRAYDPYYSPNLVQWKWDSEYNENIINEYDLEIMPVKLLDREIKNLPKEHGNKYVRKMTGESLLMFNIDGVDYIDSIENMYDKDMILIRGWVAMKDRDNSDIVCRKQLLLKQISEENIIYAIDIRPKERHDVESLFDGNTINASNSGINVFFDEKALPKGKYVIGVLFDIKKKYIKWSTQTLDIEY